MKKYIYECYIDYLKKIKIIKKRVYMTDMVIEIIKIDI